MCRSLESVLVCSLFTFWSFWLQLCPSLLPATDWCCGCGMPPPPPRQFSTNQLSGIYRCVLQSLGSRGNQGGTGSNGGPSVLRNKTTAPKNPTLCQWTLQLSVSNIQRQKYFEQCGVVWAVPLEGLSPLGCHCSASSARFNTCSVLVNKVLGTLWYFVMEQINVLQLYIC